MAATNDTIDGLLAEFRGYSAGMPASYHVTMSWADFRKMLDRFEAAHRREVATTKESLAVGNNGDCAKLREALKLCMDEMCNRCRDLASARGNPLPCLQGCEPVRKAKAALAAPPRNCDRFGGDNAKLQKVYYSECGKKYDPQDPISRQTYLVGYGNWLLALAKEGGGK